MSEELPKELQGFEQAGRLLAAAMLAYRLGEKPSTTLKRIQDLPISPSWVVAARWLQKWMASHKQEPLTLPPLNVFPPLPPSLIREVKEPKK